MYDMRVPASRQSVYLVGGRRLVFALLGVFACMPPAFALEAVTLQLRGMHQFQFAGYYAALHKGFYREAGLDVTLKEGEPDADAVDDVLAGKSDFGVAVSSLIIDFLKGKPVVILGPVFQHSPNVLLAYGRDKRLVDLAGTNAGAMALMGGEQDTELKAMFLNEGIALDKLRIVPNEHHLDDFLDGRVAALNAYISNEPYTLEQLGIPYTLIKPQTYGMDFYGDVLFTRRELATGRPEVVEAFRAASMRGWRYALDHPDEIVDLILERYNTQLKTPERIAYEARALHDLINPEVIEIGHNNPGRWQHIAQTYERFDLVKFDRPLDEFFFRHDDKADLTRLYWTLAAAVGVMLLVGGTAFYIHRVNRRLASATEEKTRTEERLRKSEARHRILFDTTPSVGIVWREGGVLTDWNRQAEAVFGWRRDEVIGKSYLDFLLPETELQRQKDESSRMTDDVSVLPHSINANLTRDGRTITCEWFNAWLPDRPGEPREVVSLAIDITERRRFEEQIRQLAFFDPLTSLPNRRLLQDHLTQVTAVAQRSGGHGALMFIDLDNFKPINDTHGHEVGDRLLIEVARRLQECVSDADTVARFGGDEFVVLLGELHCVADAARGQADQVAHKIRARLGEPYRLASGNSMLDSVEHACSASIGVAVFCGGAAEDEIFRRADTAMYRAKEAGRNRVSIAVWHPEAVLGDFVKHGSRRRSHRSYFKAPSEYQEFK